MHETQKSILKTLAWFDMFDYPLTLDGIWHFLLFKIDYRDERKRIMNYELRIKENLNELIEKKIINKKDEFYFLYGREEIVDIRKHRRELSLKKIKKAKILAKFLKFIPSIKAIFLCNSVGYLNADENSDIDLFIITAQNRIWTARWWSVGWLKLFNLRPNGNNKKDKFCLSYFVSEDNLNLEQTKVRDDDISLVYWLTTFQPLYYENDLWERFIWANSWIKRYLPNYKICELNSKFFANNANIIKKNCQEKILKKIQIWYMPKELKNAGQENNNKVIINDKMLKFHLKDKRQEDFEKWNKKIYDL